MLNKFTRAQLIWIASGAGAVTLIGGAMVVSSGSHPSTVAKTTAPVTSSSSPSDSASPSSSPSASSSPSSSSSASSSTSAKPTKPSKPAVAATCHIHAGEPDATCTPGQTDPAVTQANIKTTICTVGYTDKVRQDKNTVIRQKHDRMSAYGVPNPTSLYELDHLIPLELGGSSTLPNLWPEPYSGPDGAKAKDKVENALHAKVCNGSLDLATAQKAISTDWIQAAVTYGVKIG